MNLSTAQDTARKVYEYMQRGTAGLTRETANEVDHDPASWGMDIDDWDWNAGVGLIAISDYYEQVRDPRILEYLSQWVAKNRHQCKQSDHVNYLTPLAIYPDMYARTGDAYYRDTAIAYAAWVMGNAGRSKDGGVYFHGASVSNEVWADTVFMALVFLSRTARLTADKEIAGEVIKQLLAHLQLLQDEKTGILFHGYHCLDRNHLSGALWTRGNSWAVIGTPLILETIGDLAPVPPELRARYHKLVEGMLAYQAANGLWHTIVNRPDFYQETSGSAGVAGGLMKAVRLQLLEPGFLTPALKALEGVSTMIRPDGAVEGVSGGTPIMPSIDAYGKLTRYPTLYGQGLTLLLLSEFLLQEKARLHLPTAPR
jgi:unsaturated rhamnogalacturonyl hydrolase